MEKRNISINIETAKEWYYGTDQSLKKLVLTAYTEKELKRNYWDNIKTFEDACEYLNIDLNKAISNCVQLAYMENGRMLTAQYQLGIIKKALNGDWNPRFNTGRIYHSWLRWYPRGIEYTNKWKKIGIFRNLINHEEYTLVAGGDCNDYAGGLGSYGCGFGASYVDQSMLGCRSEEIAIHLVKYFGKIIFDAIYGQYDNYEWVAP